MPKLQRLRVVLHRHDNGEITVYADARVDVFERSTNAARAPLLQSVTRRIPSGWFAKPVAVCPRAVDELYTMPLKIIRRH